MLNSSGPWPSHTPSPLPATHAPTDRHYVATPLPGFRRLLAHHDGHDRSDGRGQDQLRPHGASGHLHQRKLSVRFVLKPSCCSFILIYASCSLVVIFPWFGPLAISPLLSTPFSTPCLPSLPSPFTLLPPPFPPPFQPGQAWGHSHFHAGHGGDIGAVRGAQQERGGHEAVVPHSSAPLFAVLGR